MTAGDRLLRQDSEPISPENNRIFIDRVLETFESFYTGDDIKERMNDMRVFDDDAEAVINYIYGALLVEGLDLVKFVDATGLLEPEDKSV